MASGDTQDHNRLLTEAIHDSSAREAIACVVLVQLSISLLSINYPNASAAFSVPLLTSGQTGFQRMREILARQTPNLGNMGVCA